MAIVGTQRTGSVFLRAFDQGVVDQLEPYIGQYENAEGTLKNGYLLAIPGVSTKIPIIMASGEAEEENYVVPSVIIRREEPSWASNRWHSLANSYSTIILSAVDRKRIETRSVAYPFDINYTLEILTRLRNQSNRLLEYCLRKYKPYGKITLLDSLNEQRTYEAFMEGVSSLDELIDAADRTIGFALTIRIEGELTLDDPFDMPGFPDGVDPVQVNMSKTGG